MLEYLSAGLRGGDVLDLHLAVLFSQRVINNFSTQYNARFMLTGVIL
jgi:hypothetical protein